MRVHVGRHTRTGPAIDLRATDGCAGRDLDPETVATAVADGSAGKGLLVIDCAEPGPLHEYAAVVREGMALRTRTALAAAARTRGIDPGVGPDADADVDAGPSTDPGRVDLREIKRRMADAEADIDRLREEVARLRGRVEVLREREDATGSGSGSEPETGGAGRPGTGRRDDAGETPTRTRTRARAARAELRDAIGRLAAAETERAAAEDRLERARERRRAALDVRERRLAAADRAGNRGRERRRALVDAVRGEFATAVRALDGPDEPFAADGVVAALACWRVAESNAPVVVAVDRLGDAREAHDRLGVPVVRV